MDHPFRDLMQDAARLTRAGRLLEATRSIQQALGNVPRATPAAAESGLVLDGLVTEVDPPRRPDAAGPQAVPAAPAADARTASPRDPAPPTSARGPDQRRGPEGGSGPDHARGTVRDDAEAFVAGRHAHGQASRDFRLYVPPNAAGRALPLVVMLHGCTQDAADFAAGTAMNERAREAGVYVLYPEQSRRANPQGCWNWFKHTHQEPHRGEPALIASMTREVVRRHGIDPDRVYVAGLSAGGAMAAIVAAGHPDVFAAAGVHSGLAPGAAASLPDALAAMRGESAARAGGRGPSPGARAVDVPTIVFHGDRDATVHPRNGERVIDAVLRDARRAGEPRVEQGTSAGGRRYTRYVHAGDGGRPDAEHWVLHGAGHAWSGGSSAGSYTDPAGPDATGEMLRFFLEHPRAAAARPS